MLFRKSKAHVCAHGRTHRACAHTQARGMRTCTHERAHTRARMHARARTRGQAGGRTCMHRRAGGRGGRADRWAGGRAAHTAPHRTAPRRAAPERTHARGCTHARTHARPLAHTHGGACAHARDVQVQVELYHGNELMCPALQVAKRITAPALRPHRICIAQRRTGHPSHRAPSDAAQPAATKSHLTI